MVSDARTSRPGEPISANELRSIGLFGQLTDAEVERLLPLLRRRSVRTNATLMIRETLSGRVCFCCSGRFRVVAPSQSGPTATVYQFQKGRTFGHVAAILGQEFGATLRLVVDQGGDLLEMPSEDFIKLAEEIPSVCRATMRELAALTKEYAGRVFDLVTLNVSARVIAELLRLSRSAVQVDAICVVKNAPTHAALASQVGASREAVTRCLRELERDQLINIRRGAIEFLNLPRLVALDATGAGDRFAPIE